MNVPVRRSAVTNMYVTRKNEYKYPPFLSGIWTEKWKFQTVVNNPFFKHGPLYMWVSSKGRTVMVNRQLWRMMMTGTMENGDGEHGSHTA